MLVPRMDSVTWHSIDKDIATVEEDLADLNRLIIQAKAEGDLLELWRLEEDCQQLRKIIVYLSYLRTDYLKPSQLDLAA